MDLQNTPTVDRTKDDGSEPLLESFIRQQRAAVPTQTPRTSLCLDTTTPFVGRVHSGVSPAPFVFLSIALGLDVWAHEPAAFRRLADACIEAAMALDRAKDLGIYGDSTREQREGAALDAEIRQGPA